MPGNVHIATIPVGKLQLLTGVYQSRRSSTAVGKKLAYMNRCRRLGVDQRHSIHFKEERLTAGILVWAKENPGLAIAHFSEQMPDDLNSPLVKAQTAAGKYLRRQKN